MHTGLLKILYAIETKYTLHFLCKDKDMSLALYYIITYSEVVNFVILKPKLRWKEINVKQKLFLTRSLCITISSTF